ncbi:MAG: hypothetical protein PQ612_02595 [Rickettsiales bacterium]|nr:hypothetical protein [Pseudomonadota bacterium]MDA0965998.1 hypothetical protein [Pseudomonadota bacterium]MDG4542531.1 hypothetical protein [Rickettsiales bacterium]MDG4545035.1 hypothetical protein [Rickettsiales bacterium]MDG4547158.1 hypothetical protein [Rickettsiales bacterium]
MISRFRLMLCFFIIVFFHCKTVYADEFKQLTVKEIGDSVLFDCNKNDSCGINEDNTISNLQKACTQKNKMLQENTDDNIKKCTGKAYKGMKELYSYYY